MRQSGPEDWQRRGTWALVIAAILGALALALLLGALWLIRLTLLPASGVTTGGLTPNPAIRPYVTPTPTRPAEAGRAATATVEAVGAAEIRGGSTNIMVSRSTECRRAMGAPLVKRQS